MTGITSILNILALLGWAVAAGGIFLAVSATSRRASARPGILLAIAGVVVGLVFAVVGAGLVIIEPQEVGVVFRSIGGDEDSLIDTPLGPGVNWIIPFVDQVTIYSTTRQNVTLAATEGGGLAPISARTSDGQEVTIDVTVIFRVTEATVNQIYRDWRTGYVEGAVVPFTREVVRNEISKLNVEEVYGQRETLGPDIVTALRPRLANEGLELVELAVRNITFSAEFVDAVERKQIAEQDVQRSQNEAEAARKAAEGERDADILRAEGDRDAEIERAKGEAEAILLRAEADAEALRLINEQISQNPTLVQWRYIEQLGDNVSLVIIPSNSPFLFDLESLAAESGMELQVAPTPEPAETDGE